MSIHTTRRQRFGVKAIIPTLALLILLGAGCSKQEATAPAEDAPAPQIAEPVTTPPVEAPEPIVEPDEPQAATESPAADKPADTQATSVDGQKIYKASCQACHVAGIAGAPKQGDKVAWAPRIAKGNDALLSSVKNGLNAMPPKGACMSCSDEELRAAIAYLVEQGS
ncbi:MAG: c-type cytochrome [Gammaproteobacteria bacterium]